MRQIRWAILLAVALAMSGWLGAAPAYGAASRPLAAGAAQTGDWRCVEVNGQVDLNIRGGPGTQYGIVATRPHGEQMDADYSRAQTANGYNWVPVRFTGGEGWVITARLNPCPSAYNSPAHNVVLDEVNQDGTLDRQEIAAIASTVVLVGNVQGRDLKATGTGTIITPDGLVLTNAHVVEGADTVALALLNDINDPPEWRYLGDVVNYDADIDAALVAIRTDLDGNPINAASLNLPYIPPAVEAREVFRGDVVTIFGYPGIGDDYLVVTSGSIVSVENGEVSGQRVPVWYRTDAEIAPGNSGGLVVNGNGEFVGIPTFVRSEEETGGRLGGIRPAQVALMAVLDDPSLMAATLPEAQPTPLPTGPAETVAGTPTVEVEAVTMDHNVEMLGALGIRIHIAFVINGWTARDATITARFYHDDTQSTVLVNLSAPELYRDAQGAVLITAPIIPCCEQTVYDDLVLFIPYEAFGLSQAGTYPLKYRLEISGSDLAWRRTLSWEYLTLTVQ